MKGEIVGKEVLEVYRKENPSAVGIENTRDKKKYFDGMAGLLQGRLKIPLRTFSGTCVFDYGCGTGEADIFLARLGAAVKGADFNPDSIRRARHLARYFGYEGRARFLIGDIHDVLFSRNSADFAISFGVLPHVSNPKKVFNNMVYSLRNQGFIIIGFVEELGIVQRLLHRSIIRAIAGFDEREIMRIAREAFPDHINRSVKFGLRPERSVVFDYLVNRHMYGLPLEKVLNWFEYQGISYYSSWPAIDLPFEINPYSSKRTLINHPLMKEYRALVRLRWLFTQYEDEQVFGKIADALGPKTLSGHVDALSAILAELVQNQKNNWKKDDLIKTRKLSRKICRELDRYFIAMQRNFSNELGSKMAALNRVLCDIFQLQRKKQRYFRSCADLFRELNGLGTFYIAGIKEK